MHKISDKLGEKLANDLHAQEENIFSSFAKRDFQLRTAFSLRQKDFYDAHIALYWFALVLTFACQAASAASEFAYFEVALAAKLSGVVLWIGTSALVVVLETAKFFVVNAFLSQLFVLGKARVQWALLLVVIVLSAASIYASVEGGGSFGNDHAALASTSQQFDTEIDLIRRDIQQVQQRNTWKGNVWLPRAERELILAKEKELANLKTQKANALQNIQTANVRRETLFQWWFGAFELVFLVGTAFVWHFRKRIAVEYMARNPQAVATQKEETHTHTPPQNNTVQPQTAPARMGFRVEKQAVHAACCVCGGDFEKRTTWQKFCSETCRVLAWQQKTGKKFYRKK